MKAYFDASVLVALFTEDALTTSVMTFLNDQPFIAVISDFAAAEFSSAVARRVRMRSVTSAAARAAFVNLDFWAATSSQRAETTTHDVRNAAAFVRRLDLPLRTPDALNIAIARRVGATLLTWDSKMADSARALGLEALPDFGASR